MVKNNTDSWQDYIETQHSDKYLSKMFLSYEKTARLVSEKCVVDVGCGFGWGAFLYLMNGASKVVGFDTDKERITFAKKAFSDERITFTTDQEELFKSKPDIASLFYVLSRETDENQLADILCGLNANQIHIAVKSQYRSQLEHLLQKIGKVYETNSFIVRALNDSEEIVEVVLIRGKT